MGHLQTCARLWRRIIKHLGFPSTHDSILTRTAVQATCAGMQGHNANTSVTHSHGTSHGPERARLLHELKQLDSTLLGSQLANASMEVKCGSRDHDDHGDHAETSKHIAAPLHARVPRLWPIFDLHSFGCASYLFFSEAVSVPGVFLHNHTPYNVVHVVETNEDV